MSKDENKGKPTKETFPDGITDAELQANMGAFAGRSSKMDLTKLNPPPPPVPGNKRKAAPTVEAPPRDANGEPIPLKQGGTGKGMAPVYPMYHPNDLAYFQNKLKQEKFSDKDTFAQEREGHFDADLNELALKEIADSRGITVEELLKSQPDRKAEVTLKKSTATAEIAEGEKAMPEEKTMSLEEMKALRPENAGATSQEEILDDEIALLEKQANELRAQAEERKKKKEEERLEKMRKAEEAKINSAKLPVRPQVGIGIELHDNPILEALRSKLSIESATPVCHAVVNGIRFEMRQPATALSVWIMEKIAVARQMDSDPTPWLLVLRTATVAASITHIEEVLVPEALGLTPIGTYRRIQDVPMDLRILTAQTLWEMFSGSPSFESLFAFPPDLAVKLYESFQLKYQDFNLESQLSPTSHRYTCPIADCEEIYDQNPMEGGRAPYCKIHGVPMDDKGIVAELRAVPLV